MTIDRDTLFIDGGWVAPSTSSRVTVLNAATEKVLGTAPLADVVDVDRAVAAARNAVENSEWSQASLADRAAAMNRFADELQKRSAEFARTVSQENGMPIGLSEAFEGGFAIGMLRYYADLAAATPVEDVRPSQTGLETLVAIAGGSRRCDRAVELPGGARDEQDRPGARRGVRRRRQTVAAGDGLGQLYPRRSRCGSGTSARRSQLGSRGARCRSASGLAPRSGQSRLHGVDSGGAFDCHGLWGTVASGDLGTRRQVGGDTAR